MADIARYLHFRVITLLQGGMKAVLWTDTFQSVMMIVGLMATLIQGSIEIGGFSKAWEVAFNNERVRFDE